MRGYLALVSVILVVFIAGAVLTPVVLADPGLQISATPAPVILPSISPTAAVQFTATATRTATPPGPALAEALEGATNVRAAPDIEAERLGVIYPGEQYPVLGRAFGTLWLKIQFPDSPNGTAWVFDQVVTLSGDLDNIPDINFAGQPTVDANSALMTQTIEAIAETPGALETATAEAFLAGMVISEGMPTPSPTLGPLPTFTYAPGASERPTPGVLPAVSASNGQQESGFPPVIPIIVLGVLGGFGLLIGMFRRMG